MPTVRRLSIAPVKGLALQHPEHVELTEHGVVTDRLFYLVDHAGRVVDGLIAGPLVRVSAETDAAGSRLRLSFPDGSVVEDEVRTGEPIVTAMYERTVEGHVVDGPFAAALEPFAGRPLRLVRTARPSRTREGRQVTLVSDGSLDALARHLGTEGLDGRRFRMLVELEGASPHEEDGWIGASVALGEAVVRVTGPVARCAITTQDPSTGRRDLDTLRAIREYRGLRAGKHLDFGVCADVERPGRLRVGDAVGVLAEARA